MGFMSLRLYFVWRLLQWGGQGSLTGTRWLSVVMKTPRRQHRAEEVSRLPSVSRKDTENIHQTQVHADTDKDDSCDVPGPLLQGC